MAEGLISTNINRQDPLSSVSGYDPERIQLSDDDLVERRIEGIINKNSPLQQQAKTMALQESNKRGLLNSTMAITAGQDALYRSALPIASQDANTSFQSKALNQQAGNTSRQFNAGEINRAALQERSGQQQLEQIGAQGDQQLRQIAAQGEQARQTQAQQIGAQTQRDILLHQQALEAAIQSGDIQAQRDARIQLYNLETMQQQQANQVELTNINNAHQQTMQQMSHEQQLTINDIQNRYQMILQNHSAAVSLYGTTMQMITQINMAEGLTTEQRIAGRNKQLEMLEQGLALINNMSGATVPEGGGTGTGTGGTGTTGGSGTGTGGGTSTGGSGLNEGGPEGGILFNEPAGFSGNTSPGEFVGQTRTYTYTGSELVGSGEDATYRDVTKTGYMQWTGRGWAAVESGIEPEPQPTRFGGFRIS